MRTRVVGIIVAVGAVVVTLGCVGLVVVLGLSAGTGSTGSHVALIPVKGTIVTSGGGGLFDTGSLSADWLIKQLERARNDSNVKAIVLEIDSPGGSANASYEIYLELQRVREAGIPIVAAFRETAASGAYYIAAPADHIVALPATITGSIGVIAQVPNMGELYEKLGIDLQIVKSGEFKDMLSPVRPLTDEEREILDEIIQQTYADFVRVVAEGRNLPEGQVRELADGRIYTGLQAQELGLVDELGDMRVARRVAGELAGLGPDPKVVVYGKSQSLLAALLAETAGRVGLGLPGGLPETYTTVRY